MANLEPINEKDLNLESKFKGGEVKNEVPAGEESPEKNAVPHVIESTVERKEGGMEKEQAYSKILSKVKSQSPIPSDDAIPQGAKDVDSAQLAEGKIEKLVGLAMEKGVVYAVKVARHMEDNYTLDEFHDRLLADELHDALVKKGLIKEL